MKIKVIDTQPFQDQKPGTAGLRRKVSVFQQPHYLENFVQAIFNTISIKDKSLVLGGDGRYFNQIAIQRIIKMAAANGVKYLWVGQHGWLSTPAASLLIRQYQAFSGLVLSASHNPAGIKGDFGIKLNLADGGAAPESVTEAIYAHSKTLKHYRQLEVADINLKELGCYQVGEMTVEVIDSITAYANYMETIFDFPLIQQWFASGHTLWFDAMHAISGPYAQRIFEKMLGAAVGSVMNAIPQEDFAGFHPDPNPTYATELIAKMEGKEKRDLGAASDGDADRNMIIGPEILVSPSDSLAILAAHAQYIPAYKNGLKGIARSMPTSSAVDKVAQALQIPLYETPTGWKFFSRLLEAGLVTLCGEESYGTSSDHIREKDGIWAVLFWLNILAATKKTVKEMVRAHWQRFGRHYYTRHDFEPIPLTDAEKLMAQLLERIQTSTVKNLPFFLKADEFTYTDPVTGENSKKQGIRILFENGDRIVYRLSGTGTHGATLRIYIERYIADPSTINASSQEVLEDLIRLSRQLANLSGLIDRDIPTLII